MTLATRSGDVAEAERRVSKALINLRAQAPFFAALALFARVHFRDDLATAATDGRDVYWNVDFLNRLKPEEVRGVLLHEVLHAALLHVLRRGNRSPLLWNIAADIVVNGMIFAAAKEYAAGANGAPSFALPDGHIRNKELEGFSVEEVYELILSQGLYKEFLIEVDLLDAPPGSEGPLDPGARRAELEAHWRAAQAQARALLDATGRGNLPAGLLRELGALSPAQVDWRSRLWRFLVRTPTDFSGFDRRFIYQSLYLEALESETLRVFVGVDTSGSIGGKELTTFLGEVRGILRAYPSVACELFYVDAAAHGPYTLSADGDDIPKPVGGGGTDFRPFFEAVEKRTDETGASHGGAGQPVCVYLTDGFGLFPEPPPALPTLWVVTPGGLDLDKFPFGETVRLLPSD